MAAIVLVHGIAQEQYSADTLERDWLPALAGGVRTSGDADLADRLWRAARPGDLETRMAYYGDLFRNPDAQGSTTEFGDGAVDLAEELARVLLANAAEAAADPRDRAEAARRLAVLADDTAEAQGPRAALRPALNGLAALRWFAPAGMGVAGKFVWRALTQVTRYLTDESIRGAAQDRALDQVGPETRLIVAHSLGSVVAYEALQRTDFPVALLTLGSPLGLRTVVYDRLRPQPPRVPATVTVWDNLADRDDLVAARLDLAPLFPPAPGSTVTVVSNRSVDNGAKPHDATHYLTKGSVGHIVRRALGA